MMIDLHNDDCLNVFPVLASDSILMLRKGGAKNINNLGSTNILRVPNIIGNKQHPTEKPIDLMRVLIENSTKENDIVLDPFMGCGSTLLASLATNRKGIEIDDNYFSVSKSRIEEYKKVGV
nr:site-specific DNA-methyltransferase [uncultured Moraxella sp.]